MFEKSDLDILCDKLEEQGVDVEELRLDADEQQPTAVAPTDIYWEERRRGRAVYGVTANTSITCWWHGDGWPGDGSGGGLGHGEAHMLGEREDGRSPNSEIPDEWSKS